MVLLENKLKTLHGDDLLQALEENFPPSNITGKLRFIDKRQRVLLYLKH